MKDALALLLTLSLLTLAAPPARGRQSDGAAPRRVRHERAAAGSYIVVLKSGVAAAGVKAAADRLTKLHGGQLTATYQHALKGFSVQLGERAAEALSRHPLVEYVEDDAVVELASTQTSAPWGLDRIDQRDLPLSDTYTYANSGAGAHVYVIDSGIRTTHEEFGGRASVAFDNVGDNGNGEDCFGHGTHVAGVVGGETYGVAKGAELHAVRVFSCTNASTLTKVIEGVDFVTSDHLSPAVAVLSVSTGGSTSLDTAVGNSVAAGVTYVVAAGNLNVDAGTKSPGRVVEAITVGATDGTDTRASFSNYGSALDLFAPGVDVPTADWFSDSSTITQSGTSLAAAHVAGVAARYLSGNPQETPAEVSASLTGNATAGAVINPGTDSPNLLLYRPQSRLLFSEYTGRAESIFVMNTDGTGLTQLTTQHERNLCWSPDGSKIAFASQRDSNWEIYVMNADGTGQTRLTNNPAYDAKPSWSPDGTKLAFTSNRDGNYEIYVVNVGSGTATRLTNNTSFEDDAEWSPGGSKIAFTSNSGGTNKVWLMNTDGTGQAQLTSGASEDGNQKWSPDGTKLAYTSNGGYEIGVINADGTNQHTATNSNDWWSSYPVWAPDSNRIAFQSGCYYCATPVYDEIFVVNADGTNLTRLTTAGGNEGEPVWSPDGNKLTFRSLRNGNYEVYSMNAGGTGQTNLSSAPGTDYGAATSPSGDKIAFLSDRNMLGSEIYSLLPDGTGRKNLTNSTGEESSPEWSPDGTKISYLTYLDASNTYEIYVMNADGTNQTRLTNNAANDLLPAWSPDGTKIAFVSSRDGGAYEIYVMNADGTNQTRLTNNPAWDNWPSWSPDGTKLYFESDRTGNNDIFVMNADGTDVTNLTNTSAYEWYALSPDGSKLAVTRNENGHSDIWVMNADGSNYVDLTPNFVGDSAPNWSPDGSRIAFSNYDVDSDEIYVMNADGTGRTRLTFNFLYDSGVDWSPDGSKITTQGETPEGITYEIFMMDSDGGNRTQVTNSSPNGGGPDPATWQPL